MTEINAPGCDFCHIGAMGSKQFTPDGHGWIKHLQNTGRLAKPCRLETIDLYDRAGNFMQKYTHCVP